MTRIKFSILLLFLFTAIGVSAQQFTREQYIYKYKDIAIQQMKKYKIPASITLAQGCLESGDGNSALARRANNHFGIKCHDNWNGKTYRKNDDARRECFRKYNKAEDSYVDHSKFLTERSRYNSLFDLKITDYKGWAHGLKAAGYATNPKYAKLLIDIIEEYHLYKYDTGAGQAEDKDAYKNLVKEQLLRDKVRKAEKKAEKAAKKVDKASKKAQKAAKKAEKAKAKLEKHMAKTAGAETVVSESVPVSAQPVQTVTQDTVEVESLPAQDTVNNSLLYAKKVHTVKAGDTLYSISRKYGITVDDIYRMNPGIKANELKIDSQIRVE